MGCYGSSVVKLKDPEISILLQGYWAIQTTGVPNFDPFIFCPKWYSNQLRFHVARPADLKTPRYPKHLPNMEGKPIRNGKIKAADGFCGFSCFNWGIPKWASLRLLDPYLLDTKTASSSDVSTHPRNIVIEERYPNMVGCQKNVLETTYQIIQILIVIYPSYPSKSILVGALPPAAANPTCSGLNWKTTSVTCASCKASMWICRLGSRQKYSPAKYQEKNPGEVLDLLMSGASKNLRESDYIMIISYYHITIILYS